MSPKLLVAMLTLVGGSAAQAAYIQCGPGQSDVVSSAIGVTATFTCNTGAGITAGGADDNLAGDNWNVEAVRLRVSGTFQENNGPVGQVYSVRYTTGNTSGFNNASCTTPGVAADGNNQALGNCIGGGSFFTLASPTDFISSFQVTVTGAPGSIPLPFNASASVFYEVQATQPAVTTVPEPGTLAIVALALMGLGLSRRRA